MTEFEEYQATGMLGSYKPEEIIGGRFGGDNKVMPTFLNTKFSESANGESQIYREMYIGGRLFRIRSVFEAGAKHTPTESLFHVIDSDLKKV